MTSPTPSALLRLAPNQLHPVAAAYRGLVYPGEVVWADHWEAAWGAPLAGKGFFRVVFLRSHVPVEASELQDARIVVGIPPRTPGRRERERELQYQALREALARYGVPGPETALLESHRELYASGTLVARMGTSLAPSGVFGEPSPQAWVTRIAEAALGWSYPRLPVGGWPASRPLDAEEVQLLLRGAIGEEQGPEVVAAMKTYGPGLGLSTTQEPATFDPRGCAVFELLRNDLAQRGGVWPCTELYHRMAHGHGLPHPLVTLYLLAFLLRGEPPTELHLRPGHRLGQADGTAYLGRVLLAETVRGLRFPSALDQEAELLRNVSPVSWNTASLYFWPLDPAFAPREEADRQVRADQLMASLRRLHAEVRDVQRALHRLAETLGQPPPEEASALLDQFRHLGQAAAPEAALRVARRLFGSPGGLGQAIARYRGLRELAERADAVAQAFRYLQGAFVPEGLGQLLLQRQALEAVLNLRELTAASFSFSAYTALWERFLDTYQAAYRQHHAAHAEEVAALQARLRDALPEAEALEKLNGLAALGEAAEAKAPAELRRLLAALAPCATAPGDLPLQEHPVCPACGLRLGEQPPTGEGEAVLRRVERGLREQNHRLSLRVVHRILEGQADARVRRFLQIVQASDLSGLAGVLDDQLLGFLGELLRAG
ncbi:MAG: hypothetical protein HY535_06615 [Chloroflexi bacterium]|nr:hypothetical protein [Chloroflexota bacterium]